MSAVLWQSVTSAPMPPDGAFRICWEWYQYRFHNPTIHLWPVYEMRPMRWIDPDARTLCGLKFQGTVYTVPDPHLRCASCEYYAYVRALEGRL